jgi:hypothetical protein
LRIDALEASNQAVQARIAALKDLEVCDTPVRTWSMRPPTVEGWYWYRASASHHAVPTFIEDCGTTGFRAVQVYEEKMIWLQYTDVEWWQQAIDQPR